MSLKSLRERVQLLETKKHIIDIYTDEYFQNMIKLMGDSMGGGERPGNEVFENDLDLLFNNNPKERGADG